MLEKEVEDLLISPYQCCSQKVSHGCVFFSVIIFCDPVLCYTVYSERVGGRVVHPTESSQTIRLPYVEMLACVVIVLQS